MTESGRLCAFITKVKRGSLADTVGHLRPGRFCPLDSHVASVSWGERMLAWPRNTFGFDPYHCKKKNSSPEQLLKNSHS